MLNVFSRTQLDLIKKTSASVALCPSSWSPRLFLVELARGRRWWSKSNAGEEWVDSLGFGTLKTGFKCCLLSCLHYIKHTTFPHQIRVFHKTAGMRWGRMGLHLIPAWPRTHWHRSAPQFSSHQSIPEEKTIQMKWSFPHLRYHKYWRIKTFIINGNDFM